jgi:outer membrane receptor protein involved in Fe transport
MFTGIALAAAVQGAALPAAAPKGEDIVVTGERVKRKLKDTPTSVVVFARRDIERLPAPDRLSELLELVPNVLVTARRDTPVIRGQVSTGALGGLPAFLGGARPRTVVQVDGRTITFTEFANGTEGLWDVAHVEVFRSPQTTTQGVNSIAGAIFINTTDPAFKFEGRARLIVGSLKRREASAAVSIPLIDDELALRVSGDFNHERSSNRMSGPIERVNLNDDHFWTGRVKLLAQPHALRGLKLLMTYAHTYSQAPQAELARRPFSERRDESYIFGYSIVDEDSLTTVATYPISGSLESRTTLSLGKGHYQRRAPQGFGQNDIRAHDRSLESVLEWKPQAAVSAVGGVSYLAQSLHQFIDLTETPFGTGLFDDRQHSVGVFGEITWHPAERLSVTAGTRYQSDSKKRVGVLNATPKQLLDYDKTVGAFLPKVSAAYDFSPDVRAGVLVQRAYNPGGVTLNPQVFQVVQFNPEYLWDYEGFIRATAVGGALSINGNVFYNDMRNAQRPFGICVPTPTGCVGLEEVVNDPRAHMYGAELQTSYAVTPALTLRGSGGLLWTKITKTLVPTDPILGKEFGGSPRFSGTVAADWKPMPKLSLSAQVRHTAGYWGDDEETPNFRIAPVTIIDARVSWDVRGFTIFAYAQNVFNKFHITGWSDLRSNPDVEVGTNDPREVGVGIEARF